MSNNVILEAVRSGKSVYLPTELDETKAGFSDLKRVTFWHGVSRFFKPKHASNQDERVARIFVKNISLMRGNNENMSLVLSAAKTYSVSHKKFTGSSFKRLSNLLYAHQCNELFNISIEHLVDDRGNVKSELLEFLRKNNLHHIIPEVNKEIRNTSVLFGRNKEIFVRSVEGTSFLNDMGKIQLILNNMKETDPGYEELHNLLEGYTRLEELKNELQRQSQVGNSQSSLFLTFVFRSLVPSNIEKFDDILILLKATNRHRHLINRYEQEPNEEDKKTLIMQYFTEEHSVEAKRLFDEYIEVFEHIEEVPDEYKDAFERLPRHLKLELERVERDLINIKESLSKYHLCYEPLKNVLQNTDNGVLVSRAYLTRGIELYNKEDWQILRPSKIERTDSEEKKFYIRIVTKLPPYSLQRCWSKFLLKFFPRIFGSHGHSWIELVKENKGIRTTYSVGYYMIPNTRLISPDHYIFIPPKKEELPYIKKLKVVEEEVVSEEKFLLSKKLIEAIQSIARNGGDDSVLEANEQFSSNQIETAKRIFHRVFGSNTCLGFAREIYKEITKDITRINIDARPWILRIIFRSSFANYWADIRRRLGRTLVIGRIISYITFVFNMQLPHFMRNRGRRA